ncbi:ABC transporter permease subunit [Paenibacillus sp. CMAA1364]
MNMLMHEWRMIRRSTLIWVCSLIGVMLLYLSIFPALSQDAEQFKALFASYPESLRDALGMSLDSIASLIGFYSFVFGFVVLIAAIQAMNLGLGMLSRETRDKTADFLLTKPVTRHQVMTAKLCAGLLSLLVTNFVYMGATSLIILYMQESFFPWKAFFMISITALFVQLIFMSLGMVVSVSLSKMRSVISISLGTVFGLYVLGMLGTVLGETVIRYITPFKYFDTAYIIAHSTYELSFVVVSLVIIIGTVSASYYMYATKDIHAV